MTVILLVTNLHIILVSWYLHPHTKNLLNFTYLEISKIKVEFLILGKLNKSSNLVGGCHVKKPGHRRIVGLKEKRCNNLTKKREGKLLILQD